MWVQATSAPAASRNSVRRRAQTRRQPTTRVVPISSSPVRTRRLDADLRRPNQPGQPALGVPGAVEPSLRRVVPRQVLGVAQHDRGPQQAVGTGLVEPDAIRRRTGLRLSGPVTPS